MSPSRRTASPSTKKSTARTKTKPAKKKSARKKKPPRKKSATKKKPAKKKPAKKTGTSKKASAERAERRRSPRVPLLADAWILTPSGRLHVQTRDLSSSGVRLCVNEGRWATGERLRVAVRLPGHPKEFVLDGVVAWQSGDGLGLVFKKVPSHTSKLIDQVIHDLIEEVRSFESEKTPVVEVGALQRS